MVQFSARGSSDRRTPPTDASPPPPIPPSARYPQGAPVSSKSTSRVPGVTRNTGWQAVQAEIVRTRPPGTRSPAAGRS